MFCPKHSDDVQLEHCDAVCFLRNRVRFLDKHGNPGAPLQGQVLLYFGLRSLDFASQFGEKGVVFCLLRAGAASDWFLGRMMPEGSIRAILLDTGFSPS